MCASVLSMDENTITRSAVSCKFQQVGQDKQKTKYFFVEIK
jgi:hypothetical protein